MEQKTMVVQRPKEIVENFEVLKSNDSVLGNFRSRGTYLAPCSTRWRRSCTRILRRSRNQLRRTNPHRIRFRSSGRSRSRSSSRFCSSSRRGRTCNSCRSGWALVSAWKWTLRCAAAAAVPAAARRGHRGRLTAAAAAQNKAEIRVCEIVAGFAAAADGVDLQIGDIIESIVRRPHPQRQARRRRVLHAPVIVDEYLFLASPLFFSFFFAPPSPVPFPRCLAPLARFSSPTPAHSLTPSIHSLPRPDPLSSCYHSLSPRRHSAAP